MEKQCTNRRYKMKILTILLLISNSVLSQNWKDFSKEKIITKTITKSDNFEINSLIFNIKWNNKLSHSDNIGFYGGIEKLVISSNDKVIQEIKNIEDNVALGMIPFSFYDYNFDGYIDFSLPLNDRFPLYYIYNPNLKKFIHEKDWDYLRIQKIDKNKKLILTEPNRMNNNKILYKFENSRLRKIKNN